MLPPPPIPDLEDDEGLWQFFLMIFIAAFTSLSLLYAILQSCRLLPSLGSYTVSVRKTTLLRRDSLRATFSQSTSVRVCASLLCVVTSRATSPPSGTRCWFCSRSRAFTFNLCCTSHPCLPRAFLPVRMSAVSATPARIIIFPLPSFVLQGTDERFFTSVEFLAYLCFSSCKFPFENSSWLPISVMLLQFSGHISRRYVAVQFCTPVSLLHVVRPRRKEKKTE